MSDHSDHEAPQQRPRRKDAEPVWNPDNDLKFIQMVDEMLEPNYGELAKHFETSMTIVKKRLVHLNQPFIFTSADEEKLIQLATEYYDKNEEPEWARIGQQIRDKPGKDCKRQYFKVMQQFWNEEKTALLVKLVQEYKDKEEKIDWKKISEQLDGRPLRVLQDKYSIEAERLKKLQQ
ncbi:SANT/Myb_domain [Hexamita inflata]|uniref:SANT/Myb domain n=1 Tax=Hexamita inflata TaxID=28002 RepID=A0AA86UM48_9EUKA|nr:SANT/Myb domain [Hexamita inflata]